VNTADNRDAWSAKPAKYYKSDGLDGTAAAAELSVFV